MGQRSRHICETIDISANKEFVILIALESNPITGYSWQASYDKTILELVEDSYELGEYAKHLTIATKHLTLPAVYEFVVLARPASYAK